MGGHRKWDMAVGLMLIVVACTSAYISVSHRAPLEGDALTGLAASVALREALGEPTGEAFQRWIYLTNYSPPLPTILYQPLMHLVPDQTLAMRLTELLFFLASIWLVFRLGVRLSGHATGFLAALLLAANPTIQGLSRSANTDAIIWFFLLLFLRVLVSLELRSMWHALALGLAAGLCLSTRLLCLVFMIGPVLWLLVFKVRCLRSALYGLVAAALATGMAGWWYYLRLDAIVDNWRMSSQTQPDAGPLNAVLFYADHGWGIVLALTLPAAGLVLWRRLLEPRLRWLLLAWLVPPAALLVLLFDQGDHYPLPAVPVCALLVALSFEHLVKKWPGRRRLAARGALAALGVTPLLLCYYSPITVWPVAVQVLMAPDRRPHDGFQRALAAVPAGEPMININDTGIWFYVRGMVLNQYPPAIKLVGTDDPAARERDPVPARYVLHSIRRCELLTDGHCQAPHRPNRWWSQEARRLSKKQIVKTRDPNAVEFRLYRLDRPVNPSKR